MTPTGEQEFRVPRTPGRGRAPAWRACLCPASVRFPFFDSLAPPGASWRCGPGFGFCREEQA